MEVGRRLGPPGMRFAFSPLNRQEVHRRLFFSKLTASRISFPGSANNNAR
jgi:hypothetical protein